LATFTSNSTTDAGVIIQASSVIKTLGASGTTRGHLSYFTEMNTQFAYGMELDSTTSDTTIDTTATLYFDLTGDWSAAGTGHVLSLDSGYIKVV
jgi:hypothetical protein